MKRFFGVCLNDVGCHIGFAAIERSPSPQTNPTIVHSPSRDPSPSSPHARVRSSSISWTSGTGPSPTPFLPPALLRITSDFGGSSIGARSSESARDGSGHVVGRSRSGSMMSMVSFASAFSGLSNDSLSESSLHTGFGGGSRGVSPLVPGGSHTARRSARKRTDKSKMARQLYGLVWEKESFFWIFRVYAVPLFLSYSNSNFTSLFSFLCEKYLLYLSKYMSEEYLVSLSSFSLLRILLYSIGALVLFVVWAYGNFSLFDHLKSARKGREIIRVSRAKAEERSRIAEVGVIFPCPSTFVRFSIFFLLSCILYRSATHRIGCR